MKKEYGTIEVKGVKIACRPADLDDNVEFDVDIMPQCFQAVLTVDMIGSENVYFEFEDDDGILRNGFCKCYAERIADFFDPNFYPSKGRD